jgi:hypothetical protein
MTMLAFAASTLIITQIVATAIILAMTVLTLTVTTLVITQVVTNAIILAMTVLTLTVTTLVITQVVTNAIVLAMTAFTLTVTTLVIAQVMSTTIIVAVSALPLTVAPLAAVIVTTIHLHRRTMLTLVMANSLVRSGYARHRATTDALMHGPVHHTAVTTAHAPTAGRSPAAGLAVITREQS